MERKLHVSNRKPVSRVRSSRRRPGCIRLFVCPTTGGRLEISVSPRETVLGLKAALARKLRVSPSKITLIYKDKVLKDGCIQDHQIPDESHVTLLPNMESGLSLPDSKLGSQYTKLEIQLLKVAAFVLGIFGRIMKPIIYQLHQSDKSIIQALENLTETQVNDFLSGRSPLMLAIRMGENMVFVQLQLSMLQGQGQRPAQPHPNMTPMTPAAAAVLSQTGLSPSAIAEATRCLSQRLHRLQLNGASRVRASASTSTSAAAQLSQPPPTATPPQTPPPTTSSTSPASPQTLFQLPPQQTMPTSLPENPLPSPPPSPGAIIETMKHLGRGVYTGTFQGTLDPSLQDRNGQPRRSVNTILHILNDLLVAAPNSPAPVQTSHYSTSNMQLPCPCYTPTFPLTPPSSPLSKVCPAMSPQDDPDNANLRGKMRRIQMMLAQRKEQRKTRREMGAPYTNPRSLQKMVTPTNISLPTLSSAPSTSSSVCMAATATATSAAESSNTPVGDGSNDPSSPYCKANIEQDSLAV